jgi:hypothetical protein
MRDFVTMSLEMMRELDDSLTIVTSAEPHVLVIWREGGGSGGVTCRVSGSFAIEERVISGVGEMSDGSEVMTARDAEVDVATDGLASKHSTVVSELDCSDCL